MNQVALQKQIEEVKEELRISGDLFHQRLVDIKAEIEEIRMTIMAITKFLDSNFSSFNESFSSIIETMKYNHDQEG